MTWVIPYFGYAALWTGAATGLLALVLQLVGRPLRIWTAATIWASLFFLMLTQYPFPDRATFACPVPGVAPILRPFAFTEQFAFAWEQGGLRAVLTTTGTMSQFANLLVCMGIGAVLSRRTSRLGAAFALGAGLTLLAETSQITGFWGLYPCAYRTFEVDDILLNIAGVVLGFWGTRRLSRRS